MGGRVHCCKVAHKDVAQHKSVWNVHGGVRSRPSIVLPRNGLFYLIFFLGLFLFLCLFFVFCLFFHWLYDVKMLFLSHVSCLVCVLSWCDGMNVSIFEGCFLPPAQVTSCMVCLGVLSVCVHVPTSRSVFCFHCAVNTLYESTGRK